MAINNAQYSALGSLLTKLPGSDNIRIRIHVLQFVIIIQVAHVLCQQDMKEVN